MPAEIRKQSALSSQIVQPLVDLATATRESKQRLYERRKAPEVVEGKGAVVEKHASRKPMHSRKKTNSQKQVNENQLGFNF